MTTSNSHSKQIPRCGAAAAVVAAAVILIASCSPIQEPEHQGTISLRLYVDDARGAGTIAAPAQFVADSAVVRVFRAGTGVTQEVSSGAAVNGANSVDITLSCIAEAGKKVSVELFSSQTMIYFGVNEQVDVVEDENTDVIIDAYDIHVNDLEVSDPLISPGDPPFDVFWNPVPAAESYLLLESSSPSFEQHLTQSFLTTDTVMTRNRPAGPWYYAVVPLNTYAVGSASNIASAYVVSPTEQDPRVDDMTPQEVVPGDRVTLSGSNLDVPGRVWLGAATCPIVSATETQLVFVVPPSGHTGAVSYENLMNTAGAPGILVVDRIAYVTRSNQDESRSQWYIDLVAAEGTLNTGVAVVPLAELADREMRVFDIIIIANDVGTGPFGLGQQQVAAIAESGAQVLAIGEGGIEYLAQAVSDVGGLSVTRDVRRNLYIPDGSVMLFQSPYLIAPPGPSTQDMCFDDQPFAGIDVSAVSQPASVTTYAALSVLDQNSFALLKVETTTPQQQTIQNVYWGYEGNPDRLNDLGSACVTNVLVYLTDAKTAVAADWAGARR